jgi:hypothetical protein
MRPITPLRWRSLLGPPSGGGSFSEIMHVRFYLLLEGTQDPLCGGHMDVDERPVAPAASAPRGDLP